MRDPWQTAAAAALCVLVATLAAHVLLGGLTLARGLLAIAASVPLLLALPGVARRRRDVLRRLAVLLVAYVGLISVEVVANGGRAWLLNVAVLTAALELGLVIALIRRPILHGSDARG